MSNSGNKDDKNEMGLIGDSRKNKAFRQKMNEESGKEKRKKREKKLP